jgi:MFS family permease
MPERERGCGRMTVGGGVLTEMAMLPADVRRDHLYRKILLRIIPFLLLCYILNSIDRSNVGMAQLRLQRDLGFTSQVYGMGIGIFYFGCILFEIPSNLMLSKIGIRKTLLRIMVVWGLCSAATMFVKTPVQFYTVRFLLGMAEGGFFPGIMLFLSYWFPSTRRARVLSFFFLGLPLSGVISTILSGWIIETFDGYRGLHGWQWMFLLEGLPAVMMGICCFFYLDDRPSAAQWLSTAEKAAIEVDLQNERAANLRSHGYDLSMLLRDPRVYALGISMFASYFLVSSSTFWGPLLIQASGIKSVLQIGLLAAIGPVFGTIAMLIISRSSDRHRERRWHFAATQFAGAGALLFGSLFPESPLAVVVSLSVITAAYLSSTSLFNGIPLIYLPERARALGVGLISTIGGSGAMVAPVMMGWLREHTGSFSTGLQIMAALVFTGGLLLLVTIPQRLLQEHRS